VTDKHVGDKRDAHESKASSIDSTPQSTVKVTSPLSQSLILVSWGYILSAREAKWASVTINRGDYRLQKNFVPALAAKTEPCERQ
jgi:hypothetical protein